MTVGRDWFWFWFWFYYALGLAGVFTLVLVLRQSSENRSMAPCLPPSPKKHCCITVVFDFSWDDCNTQERLETMVIQLFGGGG